MKATLKQKNLRGPTRNEKLVVRGRSYQILKASEIESAGKAGGLCGERFHYEYDSHDDPSRDPGMTPPDQIPYRRLFPWLHLFRACGIAIALRQILLSGLALIAIALGSQLGDWIEPIDSWAMNPILESATEPRGSNFGLRIEPVVSVEVTDLFAPRSMLAKPWSDVLVLATSALSGSSEHRSRAAFDCLWGVAVWSLFGLAICRLAAVQFARDEAGSFRQATQFGISRWRRAVSSPLIPLAAAAIVMLPVVVMAWLGRLPFVGTTWLVVVSPVLLLCGFLIAVLLLAAAVGWPLMIAAIAVDDCDGFGGLSRSYSLWTGRPAYAAWCAVVAAAFGSLLHSLASLAMGWTLAIVLSLATSTAGSDWSAETLTTCCTLLVQGLLASFGISLFWTSVTIVYLLLRQSVDKMPLDRIAPSAQERPPRDPLPVVGMPAMNEQP